MEHGMSGPILFDELCRHFNKGERLDPSRLETPIADEYDRYIGRVRNMIDSAGKKLKRMPQVYADWVINSAFNAFAVKYQSWYFIAINHGIPVIVTTIVHRMLADSRFFQHVGDPTKELQSLPLFTNFTADAAAIVAAGHLPIVSQDLPRRAYADHLCNLIFDFLAAHELAHVAHGHVDYKTDEYGLPYLSESQWLPRTAAGNLESQAMEMDADFTAAYPFVMNVKRIVAEREKLMQPMRDAYGEPAQAIFDMGVAVCILFRLFEDDRVTGVDLTTHSHPPGRFRQMMILNSIGNYIEQHWDAMLYSVSEKVFSDVLEEVERAYELVTGGPQQVAGLHDALSEAGLRYAVTLADCWNNILIPKLVRHTKDDLGPYNFLLPS